MSSMTTYQKGSGSGCSVFPWSHSVTIRPRFKATGGMRFVTTKSAMPTPSACEVSGSSVSLAVAPCEPRSVSVHDEAVPAALAHTQSTAALANAPLVSVDLPAATVTAPCALDSALHVVPPRLVTVGAVASDVTPVRSVGSATDSAIGPSPSHVAPGDAVLVPCETPFATTATGLTATAPTARLLLPATSPTTPASAVSSPCLPLCLSRLWWLLR